MRVIEKFLLKSHIIYYENKSKYKSRESGRIGHNILNKEPIRTEYNLTDPMTCFEMNFFSNRTKFRNIEFHKFGKLRFRPDKGLVCYFNWIPTDGILNST